MGLVEGAQLAATVATFVLAYMTWRLAQHTRNLADETKVESDAVRDEVKAANRQVQVSEGATQAAIMPWLRPATLPEAQEHQFVHGISVMEGEDHYQGSLSVMNIGNGLALIKGVKVLPSPQSERRTAYGIGMARTPAIAVHEGTWVDFIIKKNDTRWPSLTLDEFTARMGDNRTGLFFVDITYTDATSGQPVRMRLLANQNPDLVSTYDVGEVSYFHDDDTESFAKTEYLAIGRESNPRNYRDSAR